MKRLTAIVSIAAFIAGCTIDKGEVPVPQAPCDTTLTFSQNIQPLITLHCTDPGCHQPASAEGDLTSYQGVKEKADNGRLKQKVLVEGTMPPAGPISMEEKRMIECWLENGAKEN